VETVPSLIEFFLSRYRNHQLLERSTISPPSIPP
jgi:hypothetical protein